MWLDLSILSVLWKVRQIVQSSDCKMFNWLSGSQTTKTNSRLCSLVTKSTNFSGNRVNYFPSHSPFHINLVEPAWLRYEIEKRLRAVYISPSMSCQNCAFQLRCWLWAFVLCILRQKNTICLIDMTVIIWFQKNKNKIDLLTSKARKSNEKYHQHCFQYYDILLYNDSSKPSL